MAEPLVWRSVGKKRYAYGAAGEAPRATVALKVVAGGFRAWVVTFADGATFKAAELPKAQAYVEERIGRGDG